MKKSTIQRQRLIADFIDSENVSSQNQLKGLLKKNNIQITQATLSRDLNELGAIKKRLKNGRLIYVLPKNQDNNAQVKIAKKALEDFVLDVEPVSNQVVVKTTTAAAQVIAESIDNLYIDNIVASIAGDNVVLIISTDESKAREVAKTIEDNINNLMLLFSEYDKSLENIYISQPVVDINLGDTNNYLVRFPKFKRVTHMILAFDAENLFLKSKSSYGYF